MRIQWFGEVDEDTSEGNQLQFALSCGLCLEKEDRLESHMEAEREGFAEPHAIGMSWHTRVSTEVWGRSRLRKDSE